MLGASQKNWGKHERFNQWTKSKGHIYFWLGSDRSWPSRWQRQVGQIWTHRRGWLESSKILDFQGNLLEHSRIWEPENNIDIWQHRPSNSSTCHSICRWPPATSNSTNAWWLQMKICSKPISKACNWKKKIGLEANGWKRHDVAHAAIELALVCLPNKRCKEWL